MKRLLPALLVLISVSVDARAELPKAVTPSWTEVAPGVWKTTIGRADSLTLLSAAGAVPVQRAALAKLPPAAFPLDPQEIEGRNFNAKTTVRRYSHRVADQFQHASPHRWRSAHDATRVERLAGC